MSGAEKKQFTNKLSLPLKLFSVDEIQSLLQSKGGTVVKYSINIENMISSLSADIIENIYRTCRI